MTLDTCTTAGTAVVGLKHDGIKEVSARDAPVGQPPQYRQALDVLPQLKPLILHVPPHVWALNSGTTRCWEG